MENSTAELGLSPQETPKKTLSIVSAREKDSLDTVEWKNFLDRDRLNDAWSTPEGSPYGRFGKKRTINSVNQFANELKPRYSEGESTSESEIGNLIKTGILGKDTAVVLDSGGPHSVAMAVKLAKELGYQPIVMFNAEIHPKGAHKAEQDLATLLYFSEEVKKLKAEGKIKADTPPAFILNIHRDSFFPGSKDVDNTYTYNDKDFPDAQMFRQRGINKIVYLNEGDQHGNITPSFQSIDRVAKDLKPAVKAWEKDGIKMIYTGIRPWKDSGVPFGIKG